MNEFKHSLFVVIFLSILIAGVQILRNYSYEKEKTISYLNTEIQQLVLSKEAEHPNIDNSNVIEAGLPDNINGRQVAAIANINDLKNIKLHTENQPKTQAVQEETLSLLISLVKETRETLNEHTKQIGVLNSKPEDAKHEKDKMDLFFKICFTIGGAILTGVLSIASKKYEAHIGGWVLIFWTILGLGIVFWAIVSS